MPSRFCENSCSRKTKPACGSPAILRDKESSSYVALLKSCASKKDLNEGMKLHALVVKKGLLQKSSRVGNSVVNMYVKCGALRKAEEVARELKIRDVVTWNSLISGYVHRGMLRSAYECLSLMQTKDGIFPNAITFTCILKACGSVQDAEKGMEIHEEIVHRGLFENDLVLGNALIDMYAKCGMLDRARHVIEDMTVRDVVSWNALIAGFAQHGEGNRALEFFELMRCEGLFPDVITFTCALKACGCIKLIVEGERIHEEIIGMGILNRGMEIGNALIDMYAKCGELNKAREVLEHEIRYRNVVSWNTLITGYVQHCLIEEALDSFCRMQSEGIDPDAITFICILKCCGVTRAVEKGMEIYKEVVCKGLLRGNIVLGNALIDMFAKCNLLEKAHQVLNELHTRNVVSWSTLIIGYTQHGRAEEALNCFEEMQEKDGIPPNEVTLSCVLKACGILGLLTKVKQIHEEIIDERSLFDSDIVLRNALIDVYAKCGALSKAQEVFDALITSDMVSWSSLLAGYAQHGDAEEALHCLRGLQKNGFVPTATIFLSLLSAFSHTGLLEEGITSFGNMGRKYGIVPSIEHYACMVDLLARAGCLVEAMAMVEKLPYLGYLPIWEILMGACQKWGDLDICRVAFEHALELDHRNAEAYVSMANMYAASGM